MLATTLLLMTLSQAQAADGQSGLLTPGAEPMTAGDASVGVGGAAGLLIFTGPVGAGVVEGSIAQHDQIALGATLGAGRTSDLGGAGLIWTRVSVFEEDWLRVAPVEGGLTAAIWVGALFKAGARF